jgi:hypothetical protein
VSRFRYVVPFFLADPYLQWVVRQALVKPA